MKIFWESSVWSGATIEAQITSLAWMPSASKEGRGLLAVGSESGVVGITFTDVAADDQCTRRYNFNLRGHHSAIAHVSWNRSQSKLVSCDSSGFIYVWAPNDERWTVELVNDRGVKVRDFCWSPNGTTTLICYEDNFVLIGTAGGQRVWSNSYDMLVHCGAWSPNSDEVVLGFTSGFIQVLNEHGNVIHERELFSSAVAKVSFSPVRENDKKWTFAACSANNEIVFTNTYYDTEPFAFQATERVLCMEWSSDGLMLAVVCVSNRVTILRYSGQVIHSFSTPLLSAPLTAFTWAHDDTAVIIAAGGSLAVGRVVRGVPMLSQLVSYQLWSDTDGNLSIIDKLPLPNRERQALKELDHHVIMCRVPRSFNIPRAICEPTDWRWYCTIVPIPRKSYHYMLCMEHMGGLVPILVGRQINRIIPQFLISLPPQLLRHNEDSRSRSDNNAASAQVEDVNFRRQSNARNSLWRQSKRHFRRFMSKRVTNRGSRNPPTLVSVTSNVWCTKFKITAPGNDNLPHYLANVNYKTSVLHLQPRQMTIHLSDLRDIPQELPVMHSLSASPALGGSLASRAQSAPTSSRQTPALLRVPAEFDATSGSSSADGSSPTVNTGSNAGVFNGSNFNEADVEELQRLLDNANDAGEAPLEFDDDQATELLTDEKIFYRTVMTEFDGLRQALNSHIDRMKQVATEMELASSQVAARPSHVSLFTRKLQMLTRPPYNHREATSSTATTTTSTVEDETPQASTSTDPLWENIDFIDDDEALLVGPSSSTDQAELVNDEPNVAPNVTETSTLASMSPAFGTETSSKKRQKQLNDIRAVVEKLSMMSTELSARVPSTTTGRNPSTNLRVGNNAVGSKAVPALKQELPSEMTVAQLRAEVRNIAQQVSQIEEKITTDMLNDIRGDLQQRVQHIKAVLGEPLLASETGRKRGKSKAAQRMLTMTNKTPFWNEQTQVYQLDFGGRVTQESAKNFQIEYNSEQVMQFGRIENGAYTLDFRAPFSAIQAFAIALASITQRLK